MKKPNINFSWPASLSDFKKDEKSETFSRGKLKVFYQGETGDHRFFSEEFAQDLIKTIPYTPIVSYYDVDKDDFVGHASEQQIFGIVDPCGEYTIEKDDEGKSWYVCDVVMYTERPDKVGEWAKKIVGHKQSLELDPSSVKYIINYDEKKHFKNIEFTAGRFIGVSVLGNDQKPAFTGSEFFAYNEEFENKMKILRDYCENNKEGQIPQLGGKDMNLKEFMKLSWGDISAKVDEAICKEYENDAFTSIVDMFEDSAIVRFYYYVEGTCKLMRVRYSIDGEEIKLGNVNEVHMTYEDVISAPTQAAETDMTQAEVNEKTEVDVGQHECGNPDDDGDEEGKKENCGSNESSEGNDGNKEESSENKEEDKDKEENKGNEDVAKHEENSTSEETSFDTQTAEATQDVNVQITPNAETEKVSVDNENSSSNAQANIEENDSSSTSFTESERAEFEALKREKKIALVDSYKDNLDEEQYNNFINSIDSFEEKDLELELLKLYKSHQQNQKPMRAFAFAPTTMNANKNENSLDSFVKKYKSK